MSAEPIEQIAAIGAVIDVIADELDHKAQLHDEQGLDVQERRSICSWRSSTQRCEPSRRPTLLAQSP
jgi:hypothetical protein